MIETAYIDIKGMHCINCPIKIEKVFSKKAGVIEIDVNWKSEKGCISFDTDLITITDIVEKIRKMGFIANEVEIQTL